jgi:hypothetical protein
MIDTGTSNIIAAAATAADIDPNALLAVADVESAGKIFADIGGRNEPLIRFEGHYFDRRLRNEKRSLAREAGLASPVAGAIANPPGQVARWRMLERAMRIDRQAALESVSWGIGQVMGAHWAWLGYDSVETLVSEARSGTAGQVRLMLRFIDKSGLTSALNRRDWGTFAYGYNGPDFRRHAYQAKLARAYAKYRRKDIGLRDVAKISKALRFGSRGKAVEDMQRMLCALGFPVSCDGTFGRRTQSAVRLFQARYGLEIDGIAGSKTIDALQAALEPGLSLPALILELAHRLWTFWRTTICR